MNAPDRLTSRGRPTWRALIFSALIVVVLALNYKNDPSGFLGGLPYLLGLVVLVVLVYHWVKKKTIESHERFRMGLADTDPTVRDATAKEIKTYLKHTVDQFGDLAPHLTQALSDPEDGVRLAVVNIFDAYIDDLRVGAKGSVHYVFPSEQFPEIARALQQAQNDPVEPVRKGAASAWEKLKKIDANLSDDIQECGGK